MVEPPLVLFVEPHEVPIAFRFLRHVGESNGCGVRGDV
jgi:hypothetical protein